MVAGTLFALASFLANLSLLLMVVGAPLFVIYAHYRAPVLGGGDGVDLYLEAGIYYVLFALVASFISLLFPTVYAGIYFVNAIVDLAAAIIIGFAEAFVLEFLGIEPPDNNENELKPIIWRTMGAIVGYVRHVPDDTSVGRSSAKDSKAERHTRSSSSTHSKPGIQGGSGITQNSTPLSSGTTGGTTNRGQSGSADSNSRGQGIQDAGGNSDTKVFDRTSGDTEVFTHGSDTVSSHGPGQGGTICSSCGADLSRYPSVTFCPDCGEKVGSS